MCDQAREALHESCHVTMPGWFMSEILRIFFDNVNPIFRKQRCWERILPDSPVEPLTLVWDAEERVSVLPNRFGTRWNASLPAPGGRFHGEEQSGRESIPAARTAPYYGW